MLRHVFGRRLYGQIVWPMLIAIVVVGFSANLVAVYFISALTRGWVDQHAQTALEYTQSRFAASAQDMMRTTDLIVDDPRVTDSLRTLDKSLASGVLSQATVATGLDRIEILRDDGTVFVSEGLPIEAIDDYRAGGAQVIGTKPTAWRSVLPTVDGRLALSVTRALEVDGVVYLLRLARVIDNEMLESLATGASGDAFAVYDADRVLIAKAEVEDTREHDGGGRSESSVPLGRALERRSPEVVAALSGISDGPGWATLTSGNINYRVAADRLTLGGDAGRSEGYLVTLVSQVASDRARLTAMEIVTAGSLVGVLILAGLGFWVAFRVSAPLEELSTGAQRIADGDFSIRIPVKGASEIAELTKTFNGMTESLSERSETLTKKVLELATLYEMSRALGSTLEMDVLLESVLDSVLRIFGVDLGYVTVQDKDTGRLELRAWRAGDAPRPDSEGLRSSMAEWVIREGRPLIFNPSSSQVADQVDALTGAPAALCVPLVSAEGVLGAVTVGSTNHKVRFTGDDVRLLSTIANHVTIAIGNIDLFSSLQEAYLATVRSLAAAVDAKDPYTRGHSERVAIYAVMIAEKMGLSQDQRTALEMAAYLHDIGKIGIKEEILLKPGKLSDEEMGQMRHHPLIGANILKPVGFPWLITPVVRHHHERWDGRGYPAGLRGEEIPLLARILTAADAFEAMVSDRPYRAGRTIEGAVNELHACAGSHFDPRVVEAFVEALAETDSTGIPGAIDQESPCEEEAQAIFVALIEGMITSFRRLSGPRLASNVEEELNQRFVADGLPVRVAQGKVSLVANGPGECTDDEMRAILHHVDRAMSEASGASLVDHFYADALAGLSTRMQGMAEALGFCRR